MADHFFPEYVIEQLAGFGGVSARPMFGGVGLFKSGVMFGIIFDDELYLKVDDTNRADFQERKSEPFQYQARGRTINLSYWFVPEDIIEDASLLVIWAQKAFAIALSGRKAVASKPKARRRGLAAPPRRRR